MSEIVKAHLPCKDCGSSDALTLYADGSTYCFSCTTFHKGNNNKDLNEEELPYKGRYADLLDRKISKETCEKFGVKSIFIDSKVYQHIYPYYSQMGKLAALKIRTLPKSFKCKGIMNDCQLFGQQVFPKGGRYITITEGEIDAMSVYQMQGPQACVVSLPSGAQSAKKALKDNYDYLVSFENIILCFDGDEVGQKAARSAAELLPPSKVKIVKLTPAMKDANEYLKAGKAEEFNNLWWRAEEYRPTDIVNISDMWERVLSFSSRNVYTPTPWNGLNDKIVGTRASQVVIIGAGSGVGKSSIIKTWLHHILKTTEDKVGVFFLEEMTEDTVRILMGIEAGKNLKKPSIWKDQSQEDLKSWFDSIGAGRRVEIYDGFDFDDVDKLVDRIRFLVRVRDCKHIFLDHITMIVDNADDSRTALNKLMSRLKNLMVELSVDIIAACHLRKSTTGKPHEEGGRVTMDDLKDSSSIKQLADTIIGLERNQQSDDERETNITKVRVLKNRDFGETGLACALEYDKDSTQLTEVSLQDIDDEGAL